LTIFGNTVAVSLFIPCDEGNEIEAFQREAFAEFQAHKDAMCACAEKAIFDYYQRILPDCRARFGLEFADRLAPEIALPSELGCLVTPTEVIIQRSFTDPPERVVGLLFDCTWDTSLGLGVKFVDGSLDEVGTQDIVL
jgi:hypothetical protein